jgi:hypothetical protein
MAVTMYKLTHHSTCVMIGPLRSCALGLINELGVGITVGEALAKGWNIVPARKQTTQSAPKDGSPSQPQR